MTHNRILQRQQHTVPEEDRFPEKKYSKGKTDSLLGYEATDQLRPNKFTEMKTKKLKECSKVT